MHALKDLKEKLASGELILSGTKIYTSEEWHKIRELSEKAEHFDLLQLTKKIAMNSAYGASLNEHFRFGRRELGASVTGTGRQITTHMCQTIASALTGRPVKLMKRFVPGTMKEDGTLIREKAAVFTIPTPWNSAPEPYARALQAGDMSSLLNGLPSEVEYAWHKNAESKELEIAPTAAIYWPMFADDQTHCPHSIYSDTDSNYFRTGAANYEEAVFIADEVAALTNETFPEFMRNAFNCYGGNENLIVGAREIVGEDGLFLHAKKKYTIRVVNLDGKDIRSKPKLKSMGSEIKKADTPKNVQNFLKGLMDQILDGKPYVELESFVNTARGNLVRNEKNPLKLAPAKQVNNLGSLYAEFKRTEKIGNGKMKHCPGHVRAAINYNECVDMFDAGNVRHVQAGDKVAILYLRPNQFKLKSIGFPADLSHLPAWFNENFEVDIAITESKMIDSKIDGIFDAMGMELPTPLTLFLNSTFQF